MRELQLDADQAVHLTTEGLLAKLRSRLLDLRTNNRLIHLAHSERSRGIVRVIDEVPEHLHRKLREGKELRLLAVPEPKVARDGHDGVAARLPPVEEAARLVNLNPSFDLPEPSESSLRKHTDDCVQTLLYPDRFQTALGKLMELSRTSQEELGINTLFAAFGFVEWREREDSTVSRFAPLVLHPLELQRERAGTGYSYSIRASDEDCQINIALSERFQTDFGFRLPEWQDDEELGSYLARVRLLIEERRGWKLRRWVTLGTFSFARIAMYHDLSLEEWPEGGGPQDHPTVRSLVADRSADVCTRWDDDHPELPKAADELPSLIMDADCSQVGAILEALEQRNLVIKGPPGTGKSQTIANLIAAALARGQKVLFVAEKLAALEVVEDRLRKAGLGPFCLQLHKNNANKKQVLQALDERLRIQGQLPDPATLAKERERHLALREQLNAYVTAMNSACGLSGISVHEALWRAERARKCLGDDVMGPLQEVVLSGVEQVTPQALDDVLRRLNALATAERDEEAAFSAAPRSLWRKLEKGSGEVRTLLSGLRAYRESVDDVAKWFTEGGYLTPGQVSLRDVRVLRALSGRLAGLESLRVALLPRLRDPKARDLVETFVSGIEQWRALREELLPACAREVPKESQLRAARGIRTDRAVADRPIAELEVAAAQTLARLRELDQQSAILRRVLSHIGIAESDDPEAVTLLAEALESLRTASREVLRATRGAPRVHEPEVQEALGRLQQEAEALRAERKELQARVKVADQVDQLRSMGALYAYALRRPVWFAWLFRMFWVARAFYRRIALKPASSAEMAEDLERARAFYDRLAEFEAGEARALCGGMYRSIDTDFALLQRAGAWVREVRRQFAGLSPHRAKLVRLLTEAEVEQLELVEAECGRLDFAALLSIAARARSMGTGLAAALAAEREQAERTLQDAVAVREAGLRDSLSYRGVTQWLARYDDFRALEARCMQLRASVEALGVEDATFAMDTTSARATVQVAKELAAVEGSAEVEALLWSTSGPAVLRWLYASADQFEARLRQEQQKAGTLDALGLPLHAEQHRPLAELLSDLDEALRTAPLLDSRLRLLHARERCMETVAAPVVEFLQSHHRGFASVTASFEWCFYRQLATATWPMARQLTSFTGDELEQARQHFREIDAQILSLQARRLAAELCRVVAPSGTGVGRRSEYTELALVRHEISKQRRHLPFRHLMMRAGKAILDLTPCFMMSPLSVAELLPKLPQMFDLVVIDEASQMRPEDALGAIVRAKRAVVVGDPQQLPPTPFFQRVESGGDDEEDEDEDIDSESILDLASASFGPPKDLRWHYRSRHESLIAFSNQRFYKNRLHIFPAAQARDPSLGVKLIYVSDGRYAGSLNHVEAERVAQAIAHFARSEPNLSLGVVAMNQKQRELIEKLLAKYADEAVQRYVDAWQARSPFFIKNLENVQGDERDVIFVSMTYGPDPSTNKQLQRFFAINGKYGHRRLNVLFTRARCRMEVFSSIDPKEIRADEKSSLGVRVLRDYLLYAAGDGTISGGVAERPADSPFEEAVREYLEEAGYVVHPQVGVQGFFIDLGVRIPGDPTRFICGVECDGASHHSRKSVRDRDRLRQQVLEALGWRIVRVWSTDWFRDPVTARRRLLEQVRACAAP